MLNIKNIDIPIILYAFTRPTILEQQLKILKNVNAKHIIAVSDSLNIEDVEVNERISRLNLISKSKHLIDTIDWECSVKKIFFQTNTGPTYCGYAGIKEALKVSNKFILFDNDLIFNEATLQFFKYCLDKYENDDDIFSCVASNLINIEVDGYFLSNFILPHWGFAGWKSKINKFFEWEKALSIGKIETIVSKLNNSFLIQEFNYFKDNMFNPYYYNGDVALQLYCLDTNKKAILNSKSLIEYMGYDNMVRKKYLSLKKPKANLNLGQSSNRFYPHVITNIYNSMLIDAFRLLKNEERK